MTLTANERAALARLADILIPAGDGFPSASEAGVAGAQLDELLVARPDLLPKLKAILAAAANRPASDVMTELNATDPVAFGVLAELVPGAYFLNPNVRVRLNYHGQQARPIDPRPDYLDDGLLQSAIDRGPIYRPTLPRYDWRQSYDWNFEHVPGPVSQSEPPVSGAWNFCGLPVGSPLGIAAGPLLNGKWILYYASLGFDVLTYKTVRSRARVSYAMPNLQPVNVAALAGGDASVAANRFMRGSWAVSFGMPSKTPDFWRADVASTRAALSRNKLLSVSVVATPEPEWTLDEVAADFAQCARWAVESGADTVEANFSCPNVASADGQLYQQPAAAGLVAARLRAAVGARPLLIKIGHVTDEPLARELARALAPHVHALVMVNCVAATILDPEQRPLFEGQKRGIAGEAIRDAALDQIRLFAQVIRRDNLSLRLVGVGGISNALQVRDQLAAGSHAVQLATAAMLEPAVGFQIRRELR